ncbi:MAG: nucleoside monophosphate kinase [Candidatus Magasanikbacteria bacterium]|nr:nucleoside monophosphate kinase [Candidatus Magasanikbacteria bacterium]
MKKIIILMGVPGSGKGTQAKKIAKKYNYGHISTGDLLRALDTDANADPEDKKKLAEMKAGKLVADELIYKLAFSEMDKYLDTGKGVVLDGAVRNVEQAKKYQEYFVGKKLENEVSVIEVALSDESSYNRLTKRKVCPICGFILPYSPENELKTDCPECNGKLVIRADDNPETIKKRIVEQGNQAIKPILDFYDHLGVLARVDGEPEIVEVEREIEKMLNC